MPELEMGEMMEGVEDEGRGIEEELVAIIRAMTPEEQLDLLEQLEGLPPDEPMDEPMMDDPMADPMGDPMMGGPMPGPPMPPGEAPGMPPGELGDPRPEAALSEALRRKPR